MIYMICYDISDQRRLRKTAKVLQDFGIRVQKSFFQCEISKEGLVKLRTALLEIIDLKKDYFYIYPLCDECTRKAQSDGKGDLIVIRDFEIY